MQNMARYWKKTFEVNDQKKAQKYTQFSMNNDQSNEDFEGDSSGKSSTLSGIGKFTVTEREVLCMERKGKSSA